MSKLKTRQVRKRIQVWVGGVLVTRYTGTHTQYHICPECKQWTDGEAKHGMCDWVYGRRGWRQLGVYDG